MLTFAVHNSCILVDQRNHSFRVLLPTTCRPFRRSSAPWCWRRHAAFQVLRHRPRIDRVLLSITCVDVLSLLSRVLSASPPRHSLTGRDELLQDRHRIPSHSSSCVWSHSRCRARHLRATTHLSLSTTSANDPREYEGPLNYPENVLIERKGILTEWQG